jgi:PST family polysaccharide transporter
MVGYLANNLDNILIGRCWGNGTLGVYSTSYGLMMRPISLAGYGVGEAAIPALSRAVASPGELRPTFRRMFELTCLLGLPICFAGALWTDDVVSALLGQKWLEAIPILRWLFIAALPRMLGVCTGWVYVATGRPGRMLTWQLFWTPFIVLAFVLGLPYGAVGVAAAYAIANWVGIIPNYLYCFSGTPIVLRDIGSSLIRPLACTAICIAVGTFFPAIVLAGHLQSAGPARLAARFSVAIAAYAVVTALFIPFVHDKVLLSLGRIPRPESS